MASKLGEAYVDITARQDKFKAALGQAETRSKTAVGRIQGIFNKLNLSKLVVGYASFAGLNKLLDATIFTAGRVGDQFHKMALRTGETAETLSKLQFAAERSGSSIEKVEMALRYVSQQMDMARRNTGEAKEWFDKLDISVVDGTGNMRQASSIMVEFADKLKTIKGESEKSAAAARVFGMRAGPELLPLLKEGGTGIKALGDELERMGGVVTSFQAEAGAKFTDATNNMSKAVGGLAREFSANLLPAVTWVVQGFTDLIAKYNELKRSGAIGTSATYGLAGRMGGHAGVPIQAAAPGELYGPPVPTKAQAGAGVAPPKPLTAAEIFARQQAAMRPISGGYGAYVSGQYFGQPGAAERMRRTLMLNPNRAITMPEMGAGQQDVGMIWTNEMLKEQSDMLRRETGEWVSIMQDFGHRASDALGDTFFDVIHGRIRSVKSLLASLAGDFERTLYRTAVSQAFGALGGAFGGGGGGVGSMLIDYTNNGPTRTGMG